MLDDETNPPLPEGVDEPIDQHKGGASLRPVHWRHIDDGLGLARAQRVERGVVVGAIADHVLDGGGQLSRGEASMEDGDSVPGVDERTGNRRADEAGAADDEDAHRQSSVGCSTSSSGPSFLTEFAILHRLSL